MSGAVGSMPSLTRSGRPSASLGSSPPSGRQSTALRVEPGGSLGGSVVRGTPAGRGGRCHLRRRTLASGALEIHPANARLSPPPGTRPMHRARPSADSPRRSPPSPAAGTRADRMSDDDTSDTQAQDERPAPRSRSRAAQATVADATAPAGHAKPGAQAPLLADPRRLRRAGVRLADVRDDDGGRRPTCPSSRTTQQYQQAHNSYLYDDHWRPIGIFAAAEPRRHRQLGPDLAVDGPRDRLGRGQALLDRPRRRHQGHRPRVRRPTSPAGPTQGASTIAEQFVKNALAEEDNRTIFEKLREAALAFQLTHDGRATKILTQYLNTIYFGNGAYGDRVGRARVLRRRARL